MIKLRVTQSEMHLIRNEVVASGAVKAHQVYFAFDDTWADLKRIALFKAGDVSVETPLDENDMCQIPWEILKEAGVELLIGAVGVDHNVRVLPTVWVNVGMIQVGVGNTNLSAPSPSLYQQLLNMIGDLKTLNTTAKDNLVAAINEVYLKGDHDIAIDQEVGTMLEEIFGKFTGVPVPDDQLATNQDVDTMLGGVFGDAPPVVGEVATDQDILSMLDGVFGNKETM